MKSHVFILSSLIIGIFFQPTHQYRLSKRELTEYDLTNFIVNTCSADKIDVLIQNLCDQTLQSALMGNFPFLAFYCKTIGSGMSYCHNINRYMIVDQDPGAKRSVSRRRARSLNGKNKVSQIEPDTEMKNDFELKLIMQICMTKIETSSSDAIEYCNRTYQERYSEIERFCQDHPDIDFCRLVRSYSFLFSWPATSSTRFAPSSINSSFSSSSELPPPPADVDSTSVDEHDKQDELSSTSPSSALLPSTSSSSSSSSSS